MRTAARRRRQRGAERGGDARPVLSFPPIPRIKFKAMQLEQPSLPFKPVADRRLRVPEPLPVRLVAVNDMRVDAPAGRERELDAFYAGLLGMQRVAGEQIVYRAEN